LTSNIEAYKANEKVQRSEIDTLNSTIADIKRERELLKSDYDSLQEELKDNEGKGRTCSGSKSSSSRPRQRPNDSRTPIECRLNRRLPDLQNSAEQLQVELNDVRQQLAMASTTIDKLTQHLRAAKERQMPPPQTIPLTHRDLMSTPQPA